MAPLSTPGSAERGDVTALDRVRASLTGPSVSAAVADLFKLLADSSRIRVLDALTHGERCVSDLASLVGISESAVSHQLRLLRGARLVRVRRAGRLACYSLDDHHVMALLKDATTHVETGTPQFTPTLAKSRPPADTF